ncbi:MAG TPA: hypothetical protein VF112_02875, partial [Candidatus Dormibacteraeota bacterium]
VTPPVPVRLPPGLDSSLPGLAEVLDPGAVARRFQRDWPGPHPSPSISGCAIEHVRWSPGVECRVTYRLSLAAAAGGSDVTIGVVTATPDGVRHRLFTADPELPGLAATADPVRMRAWFSELLGREVDACRVIPVSYRPADRCVLRYRLSGEGATTVYGKVLAGEGFETLSSTAGALGDHLAPPLVGIAPAWRLVAQGDAGDRSLGTVTAPAELASGGRLLASLHRRTGPPGRRRALAGDVGALRGHLPALRRVSSEVAERVEQGIDRLAGLPGAAGVAPGHGAFRLDQVHVSTRGPVLIDLESYCWAEPARDAGNLLAYLRWRAIRRPETAAAVAEVRAAFLDGYARSAPAPLDADRLRAFEAVAALRIAGRRCHRLAVEEWGRLGELVSAALDLLATGAGQPS